MDSFTDDISAFIAAQGMSDSKFGELALNDKNFVADLKNKGRSPSLKTVGKVREFMLTYRPEPIERAA